MYFKLLDLLNVVCGTLVLSAGIAVLWCTEKMLNLVDWVTKDNDETN